MATQKAGILRQGELIASLGSRENTLLPEKLAMKTKANNYISITFLHKINSLNEGLLRNYSFFSVIMALFIFLKINLTT